MNNELLRKAVITVPVLGLISVMIYFFSTSSHSPVAQTQSQGSLTQNAASAPTQHADAFADSWPPSPRPADMGAGRPASGFGEQIPLAQTPEEWEKLAFSEEQDLQTRAESLVNLARLDSARGAQAFGSLLMSDKVDERQLAVALLRDWRLQSGDPDGRITGLLRQAADDADAGVAYQARVALNPELDRNQ